MKKKQSAFRAQTLREHGIILAMSGLLALIPEFSQAVSLVTRLAAEGQALYPIVIAKEAATDTSQVATNLASMLTRISGASFEIVRGDGATGIAVGTISDFPDLAPDAGFDATDPLRREEYLLQSHARGLRIVGATTLGLEDAVWDLLYRLGFRQFFPGPVWEIVPSNPLLELAVDIRETPAFVTRRVWYGYGPLPERRPDYQQWLVRNRMRRGLMLSLGHAYGAIIVANAAAFREHPEYYALIDGQRRLAGQVDGSGGIKFCISNPGLRALVVAYAAHYMQKDPELESISMDPSDGGNWCECDTCVAMGSVSDRVLTLANEVAVAINRLGLGKKYVSILAYGYHSAPPSIDVHPQVIVSATAGFLRGGFTLEDVVSGWQARGATMGLYDYFSVLLWDRDLPGRAKASSPAYIAESLPRFHAMGIRFQDAESSDNWGPNGLGYYAAARITWDIKEADHLDAIREDFLQRSFGPAAQPMREFYRLIDRDSRPLLSADLLGRMYRALQKGLDLTPQRADIQARIGALALYARYADLWLADDMTVTVRHAHRIRDTGMVHFKGLWVSQREKLSLQQIPATWISDAPYSANEVRDIIAQGIATHAVFEFEPVSYSEDLVPVAPLKLPETPNGSFGTLYARFGSHGGVDVHTWFDQSGALDLQVTGGLIAHYRDRGNVRIALYSQMEVTPDPVATDNTVPPDGEVRQVRLVTPFAGLHRLELQDGDDCTRVIWPDDWPLVIKCSPDAPKPPLYGDWSMVFYVPRGTKSVAGFTDSDHGKIVDGTGRTVLSFSDLSVPCYFNIPVPEGADRALWRIENHASRTLRLLTVPPYLARNGKELLLPREVVDADSAEPVPRFVGNSYVNPEKPTALQIP